MTESLIALRSGSASAFTSTLTCFIHSREREREREQLLFLQDCYQNKIRGTERVTPLWSSQSQPLTRHCYANVSSRMLRSDASTPPPPTKGGGGDLRQNLPQMGQKQLHMEQKATNGTKTATQRTKTATHGTKTAKHETTGARRQRSCPMAEA